MKTLLSILVLVGSINVYADQKPRVDFYDCKYTGEAQKVDAKKYNIKIKSKDFGSEVCYAAVKCTGQNPKPNKLDELWFPSVETHVTCLPSANGCDREFKDCAYDDRVAFTKVDTVLNKMPDRIKHARGVK